MLPVPNHPNRSAADVLREELRQTEEHADRLRLALAALEQPVHASSRGEPVRVSPVGPPPLPSPIPRPRSPGKTFRRRFSRKFKREAVYRAWGPGGVGASQVARELYLHADQLWQWKYAIRDGRL